MRPPEVHERGAPEAETPRADPWWHELRPGKSLTLFPVVVAAVWGVFLALLGTVVRLTTSGDEQPSWGELALSTAMNAAGVFVIAFVISVGFRIVQRRTATTGDDAESTEAPESWLTRASDQRFRGHLVLPTTVEGRLALLISLVAAVPFLAGPAMLGAAVFFVFALRHGDRGLLLIVPGLLTVFFVVFIVLEFAVGHD